jgi:hypothetical protein
MHYVDRIERSPRLVAVLDIVSPWWRVGLDLIEGRSLADVVRAEIERATRVNDPHERNGSMNDYRGDRNQGDRDRELPSGRLPAKLITYDIGRASTGTEQIGVLFELTEEPWKGQQITWYGTFTDESLPITMRGLKELGWQGQQVTTLRQDLKPGTPVQLVIEIESYQNKRRPKVKFINRRGLVRMDRALTKDERADFATVLQSKIDAGVHLKPTGKSGQQTDDAGAMGSDDDDDIPF